MAAVAPAAAPDPGATPPDPAAEDQTPAETGPDTGDAGPSGEVDAAAEAEADLKTGETAEGEEGEADKAAAEAPEVAKQINILELLVAGGHLMWPILIMSLLVVTFGVERLLGLRRSKILPPELIAGLGKLAGQKGGLDPRSAYKLCQQYPSSGASVIKTMLLKVGRPHSELEHAVTEANEREAARLFTNVRWLSLAAAVTPLMGLLGTVWGMIQAFFATANLPVGANKAQKLADGIYVALVTTFAGLAVAIPAAVLAHFYEGRIQKILRELDETLLGLMPQLERFEGRLRVSKEQMEPAAEPAPDAGAAPPARASAPKQQPAPAAK
jgi:biopolymer transport protein ExbB